MNEVTYMNGHKLTISRRDILKILKGVINESNDANTMDNVLAVENWMEEGGFNYSECTQRQFNRECKEAISEINLK